MCALVPVISDVQCILICLLYYTVLTKIPAVCPFLMTICQSMTFLTLQKVLLCN